jgi:hypothetical protein
MLYGNASTWEMAEIVCHCVVLMPNNFVIFRQGYQMFGVKTSFIATRSGLLRWKDHINHSEDALEP